MCFVDACRVKRLTLGKLLPYNVYPIATFCRVFEEKIAMHIPYGLNSHYRTVILKVDFKCNFDTPSLSNLYLIGVPVQISTGIIHQYPWIFRQQ